MRSTAPAGSMAATGVVPSFPIASRLENWMHPPFGQSLFTVLRKGLER